MRRLNGLIFIAAIALAACAGNTPTATPTSQTTPAAVPVTIVATSAQATVTPAPSTATTTPAQATATPQPTAPISTPTAPQPIATETLVPLPKISLSDEGINVSNYNNDNIAALQPFGFGWIQVFNPPDHPIANYKILHRVVLGNAVSGQPADVNAWAAQLENLARERKGIINAYSIGNEVNLSREWGGKPPDPLLYTRLLAIAYARIKTADPDAIVVSAGIAPTGGDSADAMDDLNYARAMFEAGAANFIDAYGFHPYGFAYEPERDPNDPETKGLNFRRAEAHRALMEEFGAGDKQMWATEFGWIIDAKAEGLDCTWPSLDWQRVSRNRQAEYVVKAYDFAAKNWPWMGPMFLWNYDFSLSDQYPDPCEQMKFFSMLDEQGKERPLFGALKTSSSP
jgi:ABC-type Fe3+-hydroxamate transport system substrate-binding protein